MKVMDNKELSFKFNSLVIKDNSRLFNINR